MTKRARPIAVALGFLIRFSTILLAFVGLSRIYSPENYGDFRRVWLVLTLASVISQAGIPAAIERFLPRLGGPRQRRQMFGVLIGSMLTGGVVTSLALKLFSLPLATLVGSPKLAACIASAAWLVPTISIMNQSMLILAAAELHLFATFMSTLLGGTFLAALWLTASPATSLSHTFFSLSTWMMAPIIILILGSLWLVGTENSSDSPKPSINEIKSHAAHAWSTACLTEATRSFPKTVASAYSTSREFAVFSNGAIENPILGIIFTAITSVTTPKIARAQGKDKVELERILRKFIAATCMFTIPLSLLFIYKAQSVMVALYGTHYAESSIIFSCFSLVTLVRILPTITVLNCLGLARENSRLSVLNMVLIGTSSFLAGVYFGFVGIAVAIAVTSMVMQVISFAIMVRAGELNSANIIPKRWISRLSLASFLSLGVIAVVDHLFFREPSSSNSVWVELLVLGHIFLLSLLAISLLTRLYDDNDWPFPRIAVAIRAKATRLGF